jgi:hypothetical protein
MAVHFGSILPRLFVFLATAVPPGPSRLVSSVGLLVGPLGVVVLWEPGPGMRLPSGFRDHERWAARATLQRQLNKRVASNQIKECPAEIFQIIKFKIGTVP